VQTKVLAIEGKPGRSGLESGQNPSLGEKSTLVFVLVVYGKVEHPTQKGHRVQKEHPAQIEHGVHKIIISLTFFDKKNKKHLTSFNVCANF